MEPEGVGGELVVLVAHGEGGTSIEQSVSWCIFEGMGILPWYAFSGELLLVLVVPVSIWSALRCWDLVLRLWGEREERNRSDTRELSLFEISDGSVGPSLVLFSGVSIMVGAGDMAKVSCFLFMCFN